MKRLLSILILFPFLLLGSELKYYYWKHNLEKGYYILYLKFHKNFCPQKGDIVILVSQDGYVYKKSLKRKSCLIRKYFKSLKSKKLLLILFKRKAFDIKNLGIIKAPLSSD